MSRSTLIFTQLAFLHKLMHAGTNASVQKLNRRAIIIHRKQEASYRKRAKSRVDRSEQNRLKSRFRSDAQLRRPLHLATFHVRPNPPV